MDIGLYGKLPSHGDFLRRRVDDAFVGVWDAWLQQGIAASRAELGERWLDIYLTSPVWRFTCDAGACGAAAYAGLMAPSVDRVGRYFPLTVVWQIPDSVRPLMVMRNAERWFDTVERLLVEALAAEQINFDAFYEQLSASSQWLSASHWSDRVKLDQVGAQRLMSGAPAAWQLPLGFPPAWGELHEQLVYAHLRTTQAPLMTLWTEGSAAVEPCCLFSTGLPPPRRFTALLDGNWQAHDWLGIAAVVKQQPPDFTDTLVDDTVALQFSSEALSDAGCVRQINQDAFLAKPESGLWVVADGIGGFRDGDVASRMVCDALADMPLNADLDAAVETVKLRLQDVNGYLHRVATRSIDPVQSGSTVVVVITRGSRAAVLWAGDSRVYRWRDGRLTQLTSDHSWSASDGATTDNAITRAVGGEVELLLDVHFERVHPGDRFLLCSDGLTREVDDAHLSSLLSENAPMLAARRLVDAALASGGKDNITVVVVDADPTD